MIDVIQRVMASVSRPYFLQIGSNDGVTGDPIYHLVTGQCWPGLAVEPIDHLAGKLRQAYRDCSEVKVEAAAIGTHTGTERIYRVGKYVEGMPWWWDQVATFHPRIIADYPLLYEHMVYEEVRCLTLADLVKKHRVAAIDLLHIDAEGHDYEVLKQFDFSRFKPRAVLYEQRHLMSSDRQASRELLLGRGYSLQAWGPYDTLGLTS